MEMKYMEVAYEEPHKERAKGIRKAYPDVKVLHGRNVWTAWLALLLVASHLLVGIGLVYWKVPWWGIVLTAWGFGAFVVHGLFAVIHESCHGLVFRSKRLNKCLMLFANIPGVFPFAVPLGHYHLVHHQTQGEVGRDPDLPVDWELSLFDRGLFGKWAWHILFPFLQLFRIAKDPRDMLSLKDRWFIANILFQSVVTVTLFYVFGSLFALYLGTSLYFMFALHPLSGRFIQEHFVMEGKQETNSYYGVLNRFSMNLGYHTEHHDFPGIPWNRLPTLKSMASEWYETRYQHASWGALWLRFLFSGNVKLQDRVVRPMKEASQEEREAGSSVVAHQVRTANKSSLIPGETRGDGSTIVVS